MHSSTTPIKVWSLDMPAETFAGASMLVRFEKDIPFELPDDPDGEEHSDVETVPTNVDRAIID